MKHIQAIFHHSKKNDEDCTGDYYSAELLVDGVCFMEYSDEYHDKPRARMDGFREAMTCFNIPFTVLPEKHLADAED